MGYIHKPFSTRMMIFCVAIILIGGAFAMYGACTLNEKPCCATVTEMEMGH